MALNAKNYKAPDSGNRPDPIEPGTYPARVVQIISLGLQEQPAYKGKEKPPKHMIYVTYELLDEFLKDEDGNDIEDKPRWISESFTMNSLQVEKAKSTERYLALDPSVELEGDWAQLAGVPCMVTISQDRGKKDPSRIYNNVSSVQTMRPKEAAKAPDLVNPAKIFDIDEPDVEVFLSLPEWLQEKIKGSLEYDGSALERALEARQGTPKGEDGQKKSKALKGASKAAAKEDEDEDEDW
jgi:hypothetical protein